MVKCKRCKEWFYEACEKGDFENDDWLCCSCEEIKKWRESKLKPDEGKRKKLLLSAETHPQESRELHSLYASIRGLLTTDYNLSGDDAIGCIAVKTIKEIFPEHQNSGEFIGITFCLQCMKTIFICIVPELFPNYQTVFDTVVHEMAHAINFMVGKKGTDHGNQFKSYGRKIIQTLQRNMHALPKPFCNCDVPSVKVLNCNCP